MTPVEELRAAAAKLRKRGGDLAEPLAAWLDDHANDHGAYDCTWDEADCPALRTARVINGGAA
jgi:hypothetical protein